MDIFKKKSENFNTGKIFGKVAKEMGFLGSGVTRYIEYSDYWLLINHQKSFYSRHFYVKVGLFYKEILSDPISETDLKNAFKGKTDVFPHVTFIIEHCHEMPDDLTIKIGRSVENENSEDLTIILKEAFEILLYFMEKNYKRQSIRKLFNEKKLASFIYKDV